MTSSSNGNGESSSYRWPGSNSSITLFLDTLSPEAQQFARFLPYSNPSLTLVPTPTEATHVVLSPDFPSINLPLRDFLQGRGIKVVTLEWVLESIKFNRTLPVEGFRLVGRRREEGGGGSAREGAEVNKGKGKEVRQRSVSVELEEEEEENDSSVAVAAAQPSSSSKRARTAEDSDGADVEDPASSSRTKQRRPPSSSSSNRSPSNRVAGGSTQGFTNEESVDFCDLMAHYPHLTMTEKLKKFCEAFPTRTPASVSSWYYDNRQLFDAQILKVEQSLEEEARRAPAASSSSKPVEPKRTSASWTREEDERLARSLAQRGYKSKASAYQEFSRTSDRTFTAISQRVTARKSYFDGLIKAAASKPPPQPSPHSAAVDEGLRKLREPVAGPSPSSSASNLASALQALHEPVAGPAHPQPSTTSSSSNSNTLASALAALHEPGVPPRPPPRRPAASSNPLADAMRMLHEPIVPPPPPPPPPGSTSPLGSHSSLDIKPTISFSSLSSRDSVDVKPRIPFHSNSNAYSSPNPFTRHSTIDRSASPSPNHQHQSTNAVASGSGSNTSNRLVPPANANSSQSPSTSTHLHRNPTNPLSLGAPPPQCPPGAKFCFFCSETQSRGGFEWIDVEQLNDDQITLKRRKERACRFCATWMRETMSVDELVGEGEEEEEEMSLMEGTRLLQERGVELRSDKFGGQKG